MSVRSRARDRSPAVRVFDRRQAAGVLSGGPERRHRHLRSQAAARGDEDRACRSRHASGQGDRRRHGREVVASLAALRGRWAMRAVAPRVDWKLSRRGCRRRRRRERHAWAAGTPGARGSFESPSWSPDGKQVVFRRETVTEWPPARENTAAMPRFACSARASFRPTRPMGRA